MAQADYAGRPDVLGRLNPGSTPSLLLNGHVDVVPAEPELYQSLVEAFRATLEEVKEADVVLHVRDIASEPGKGSTFRLVFPALRVRAAAAAPALASPREDAVDATS